MAEPTLKALLCRHDSCGKVIGGESVGRPGARRVWQVSIDRCRSDCPGADFEVLSVLDRDPIDGVPAPRVFAWYRARIAGRQSRRGQWSAQATGSSTGDFSYQTRGTVPRPVPLYPSICSRQWSVIFLMSDATTCAPWIRCGVGAAGLRNSMSPLPLRLSAPGVPRMTRLSIFRGTA